MTEFSGDALPFQDMIFDRSIDGSLDDLRETDLPDPRFVSAVAAELPGFDGLLEVILAEVPKPEGVVEENWRASPLRFLRGTGAIEGFDRTVFLARIEREVVAPVRDTAARFGDAAKVTRLYTTMSAEDMTRDPMFDFNPDLADYNNVHIANRVIECNGGTYFRDARWRVRLPDGSLVRGQGSFWPSSLLMLPANTRTRRLGTSGHGEVVLNNTAEIAEQVSQQNERAAAVIWPVPSEEIPPPPTAGCGELDGDDDAGGCALHIGPNPSGQTLFFVVGLALIVRRLRRQ